MKRIQIDNFEEGLIKKVSPEDIPVNAMSKCYDATGFNVLGLLETRGGRTKVFDDYFEGLLDIKFSSLFNLNRVFVKAGTALFRGIRPIKLNIEEGNRMDFTEFADWLIMCDGVNNLKYKETMELSWLTACCFDFEEDNIPSGWTIHQSAIPFILTHDVYYACTYDWERSDIDGDISEVEDGVFFTSNVDIGMALSSSIPDANFLLHLNSDLTDTIGAITFSAAGNAAITTAEKKFGGGCLALDGTGDYIYSASNTAFNLGSGAFTVDFWFSIAQSSANAEHCFISHIEQTQGMMFWYNDVTQKFYFWATDGTNAIGKSFSFNVSKAVWYHVAIIRGWEGLANRWAICVNGSARIAWTQNVSLPTVDAQLWIGDSDTSDDGTLLDESVSPSAVTYVSEAQYGTAYSKWGDGCIQMVQDSGTNPDSYLSIPYKEGLTLDQDFTFDFWFRHVEAADHSLPDKWFSLRNADTTKIMDLSFYYNYSAEGGPLTLFIDCYDSSEGALLQAYVEGNEDQTIDYDEWIHIAFIRVGNAWGLYYNGVQAAFYSGALSASLDMTGSTLRIGSIGGANGREVYLDEIRFTSANEFSASPNAAQSDRITVPNGRHDVDSNTQLLIRPGKRPVHGYIDEVRWKKGGARWVQDFSVPTGEDTGADTTVSRDGTLGGDMAVPLGMDAPSSAPSVATGAAGALSGNYYYKITFVNADSFESNGSDASVLVQPSSDIVELTDIPQSNNPQVVSRNIYRTVAGGSTYYLLTTIEDNYTTTYSDNNADSTLGAMLESYHDAPPALQCVHSHSSRLFGITAANPNKLVWCNGWDEWEYFDTTNYEAFGSSSDNTKKLATINKVLVLIQKGKVWTFDTRLYPEFNWIKSEGATVRGVLSVVSAVKAGDVILCADAEGPYLLDGIRSKDFAQQVDPIFDPLSSDPDIIDSEKIEFLAVAQYKKYYFVSYSTGDRGQYSNENTKTIVYRKDAQRVEQIMSMGFSCFSTDRDNKVLYGAGSDGYIYQLYSDEQDAGSDVAWQVETKDFNGDIGPEMLRKEAGHFWIDCNPNGNNLSVNIYLDDVSKLGQTISGSSRVVTTFRLPDEQFYRLRINLAGTGFQRVYRLAFEAENVEGPSEIQG